MSKRATLTVGLVLLAGLPALAINTNSRASVRSRVQRPRCQWIAPTMHTYYAGELEMEPAHRRDRRT